MENQQTSLSEFRAVLAIAIILALALAFPRVYDRIVPNKDFQVSINHFDNVTNSNGTLSTPTSRIKETWDKKISNTELLSSSSTPLITKAANSRKANRASVQDPVKGTRAQGQISGAHSKSPQKPFSQTPMKAKERYPIRNKIAIHCEEFDPNEVSVEQLMQYGLRSYAANNLVKYRNGGGTFKQPADVAKIYGMDSIVFQQLQSCIKINTAIIASLNKVFDINVASNEELQDLPGIGEYRAKCIIKFREHLGGFHSIAQVAETYGLPPEVFTEIQPRLKINRSTEKLDINYVDALVLASHPYISKREANMIVNYRGHHGSFANAQELLDIRVLTEEWLERVMPYLKFGDGDVVVQAQ